MNNLFYEPKSEEYTGHLYERVNEKPPFILFNLDLNMPVFRFYGSQLSSVQENIYQLRLVQSFPHLLERSYTEIGRIVDKHKGTKSELVDLIDNIISE